MLGRLNCLQNIHILPHIPSRVRIQPIFLATISISKIYDDGDAFGPAVK